MLKEKRASEPNHTDIHLMIYRRTPAALFYIFLLSMDNSFSLIDGRLHLFLNNGHKRGRPNRKLTWQKIQDENDRFHLGIWIFSRLVNPPSGLPAESVCCTRSLAAMGQRDSAKARCETWLETCQFHWNSNDVKMERLKVDNRPWKDAAFSNLLSNNEQRVFSIAFSKLVSLAKQ